MVRLRTAELDIVDTLIAAGIANNRAEAIRWALTRIPRTPRLRAGAGSTPATLNGSRASSNAGSPGYLPADARAPPVMTAAELG